MKVKYIVLCVFDGVTKQFEFPVSQKAEAISAFKNVSLRADRAKLFSIDSEDESIWYDLSNSF